MGAIGRNRRRYGGYVVHVGIAILLIGIAASSSFQTNRDLRLDVGESATVGDYTVTYEGLDADPENERIAFAATARRPTRTASSFALLAPARNYYPTQDPMAGPIGRYFEGEATSEVGLRSGAGRGLLDRLPAGPLHRSTTTSPAATAQLADLAARRPGARDPGWPSSYAENPPPATFRVIVNPLVVWIWIGALIALGGACSPLLARRPRPAAASAAAYAARLGRELDLEGGAALPRLAVLTHSVLTPTPLDWRFSGGNAPARALASARGARPRHRHVALVALFVSVPLRRAAGADDPDPRDSERAELEARKEAKYREIRDAEADRPRAS